MPQACDDSILACGPQWHMDCVGTTWKDCILVGCAYFSPKVWSLPTPPTQTRASTLVHYLTPGRAGWTRIYRCRTCSASSTNKRRPSSRTIQRQSLQWGRGTNARRRITLVTGTTIQISKHKYCNYWTDK